MSVFYITKANKVATEYLRSVGLNSITWEHFTGDFKSVINYLEKIANHIYDVWGIDQTEIFTSICHKSVLKGWDEKHIPNLKGHTHICMNENGSMTAYGDFDVNIEVVDTDFLKRLEYDLHCTIANQVESN